MSIPGQVTWVPLAGPVCRRVWAIGFVDGQCPEAPQKLGDCFRIRLQLLMPMCCGCGFRLVVGVLLPPCPLPLKGVTPKAGMYHSPLMWHILIGHVEEVKSPSPLQAHDIAIYPVVAKSQNKIDSRCFKGCLTQPPMSHLDVPCLGLVGTIPVYLLLSPSLLLALSFKRAFARGPPPLLVKDTATYGRRFEYKF